MLSRFEKVGLKIVAMKNVGSRNGTTKEHYSDDLIPIVGGKPKRLGRSQEYTETVEQIGDDS